VILLIVLMNPLGAASEGNAKPEARKAVEAKPPQAEATGPKATEPKATGPKATEPKATEPKATGPKATEPKATEPKATGPKATGPKAAEPKATGPKATEPKAEEAEGDGGGVEAAVAKPVPGDLVQIYGWREMVLLEEIKEPLRAKLDTGALTSSVHAEEKELFERDGKKWVRFIMTDPTVEKPVRRKIEAPLVRIAQIKEPGGESVAREVVKLSFQIGERKMRGDFSLNNRSNMLAPVLLGRSIIKDLGWVDSSRTNLAEEKIFR
jgi:hypothetical protein